MFPFAVVGMAIAQQVKCSCVESVISRAGVLISWRPLSIYLVLQTNGKKTGAEGGRRSNGFGEAGDADDGFDRKRLGMHGRRDGR